MRYCPKIPQKLPAMVPNSYIKASGKSPFSWLSDEVWIEIRKLILKSYDSSPKVYLGLSIDREDLCQIILSLIIEKNWYEKNGKDKKPRDLNNMLYVWVRTWLWTVHRDALALKRGNGEINNIPYSDAAVLRGLGISGHMPDGSLFPSAT